MLNVITRSPESPCSAGVPACTSSGTRGKVCRRDACATGGFAEMPLSVTMPAQCLATAGSLSPGKRSGKQRHLSIISYDPFHSSSAASPAFTEERCGAPKRRPGLFLSMTGEDIAGERIVPRSIGMEAVPRPSLDVAAQAKVARASSP